MTIEAAFAMSARHNPPLLAPLAIRGCAALLPGITSLEALRAAELPNYRPTPGQWFDPKPFIGERGHKYYTGAAKLVSAAIVTALDDARLTAQDAAGDDVGIAIGTNFAAHPALADIDASMARTGIDGLSPLTAPHFSINLSACLAGIRTATTGFNVTLTEPVTAGLSALVFARHAIAGGFVQRVIAGACEEEADTPLIDAATTPRSGAAVLVLERAPKDGAGIVEAFSMRLTESSEDRFLRRVSRACQMLSGPILISATALRQAAREQVADLICKAALTIGLRSERLVSSTDDCSLGAGRSR